MRVGRASRGWTQVGTQNISPLFWSIESGSLEAARAMIQDLLTIRADRDRQGRRPRGFGEAKPTWFGDVERACHKRG